MKNIERFLNRTTLFDALEGVRLLPDRCVHAVVTSPPYWGLRDYGIDGQMGQEETFDSFIEKQVTLFREIRRVLRDDGTLWVNMGDSYASKKDGAIKAKDMIGQPWALAFALRSDGWYLRQDIIWHKPNPMPQSAVDRCTSAHEYIFLFSKSPRYYFDAYSIATPYKDKTYTALGLEYKTHQKGDGSGLIQSENWDNSIKVRKPKEWKMPDGWDTGPGSHGAFHRNGRKKGHKNLNNSSQKTHSMHERRANRENAISETGKANKRSVWTVATNRFEGAHFATFPPELIVDCIKAGCPPGGIVLDPFHGAGTTGLVARKLGRNFIGMEINPEYKKISDDRHQKELGMFL